MKNTNLKLVSLVGLLLCLSILSSCKDDENLGKGGLDTSSQPITYTSLTSEGNLTEEVLPELEYFAYRLKKGDMIGQLAIDYGVTEDTLISVNNIKATRNVWAGDCIKIPTIPGILYTVRNDGETIDSISQKYEINPSKCAKVNNYEQTVSLKAGTSLFLPDAELDWVTRQEINGDLFTRPIHSRKLYCISSNWGWRKNPFSGKRSFHGGIDMASNQGTTVYAALAGKVTKVGEDRIYGKFVEVAHHSGYKTLYAHLSKITCSRGQYVSTSTKLGEVGTTGMSTGNHLHFAIYKNGISQNPRLLVDKF
ncbi:MAG: M23 family metallopeptidase [Treponemataceae bacterium]|nr:M23 family metallopeptidase [Treponemataceae bacterium]